MNRKLILVISLFCSSLPLMADCTEADRRALEELDRAWTAANLGGVRTTLQQIYADDYAAFTITGTQSKTQAIDSAMRQFETNRRIGTPQPTVVADRYIVRCTPNTATLTHRNVITSVVDGKEQTTYARSVHVMEKRGGRWQVVSSTSHPLNDAAVLQYMEQEWNDALINRDASWFEHNFARDYSGIHIDGTLRNKAEDIAAIKDMTITSAALSDLNVRVNGDTAVVTGINHVRGRDKAGKPFDERARFTDVYVRRDGRWQVLATHATRIEG